MFSLIAYWLIFDILFLQLNLRSIISLITHQLSFDILSLINHWISFQNRRKMESLRASLACILFWKRTSISFQNKMYILFRKRTSSLIVHWISFDILLL